MTSTVPHQALYRRWRAQTFSQIVGQEAVVETLRNAVRTERVSHAILFVGPRGTGKTSLARILAKAVNCTDLQDGDPCDACDACVAIREGTTLDVLEIDAASNRGINEVRELRDRLAYPPGHLRRKVYILDEAHQITKDAWNALLKSLEEPPDFVIFMFASTEPSGFPPAILSRLQRYDVRRLTIPEIEGKLRRILEADGRTVEPGRGAPHRPARGRRHARRGVDPRPAALDDGRRRVTEADVRDLLGLADAAAVDGFVDALLAGDAAAGIAILDRSRGARPRPAGAAGPGRRRGPRPARRRGRRRATRPVGGARRRSPDASSPSTRTAPASAACGSSSSSRSSAARRPSPAPSPAPVARSTRSRLATSRGDRSTRRPGRRHRPPSHRPSRRSRRPRPGRSAAGAHAPDPADRQADPPPRPDPPAPAPDRPRVGRAS